MNILIDADACPVKEIAIEYAKTQNIPVIMICDTSHILKSDYAKVVTVDKSSDSADIYLANSIKKYDVAITQDYGVAALCLGKGAFAINQNGMEYTSFNIDRLLFERHISKKLRKGGYKTSNMHKRTAEDDEKFAKEFQNLIKKAKSLEKSL